MDGEDRILNDLKKDSETLEQVVTRWLFENFVPTVCFYEQHVTDYGSKADGLFPWKEIVCTFTFYWDSGIDSFYIGRG